MPRCAPPIGRSSVTPCSTRSTATQAPRFSTCCRACGPRPFPVSRPDGRRWANATTSLEPPLPISPATTTNGTPRITQRWSLPATSRTRRSLRKPSATSAQFRRRSCRRATKPIPFPSPGQTVEAEFPFPFEIVDLAYAIPGDTQRGEPADQHAGDAAGESALAVLSSAGGEQHRARHRGKRRYPAQRRTAQRFHRSQSRTYRRRSSSGLPSDARWRVAKRLRSGPGRRSEALDDRRTALLRRFDRRNRRARRLHLRHRRTRRSPTKTTGWQH